MPKLVVETVADLLYCAYANLGMAQAAIDAGVEKYGRKEYMIRSRLFHGLRKGTLQMGSMFRDEKLKLEQPKACCYCGSKEKLSLDHMIPQHLEGGDGADNLVWACRRCNSSKGGEDLLAWYAKREKRPPLLLYRRYLKLAIAHCARAGVMDVPIGELAGLGLPFQLEFIITWFPDPLTWDLWVALREDSTEAGHPSL